MTKICTKCGKELPATLEYFSSRKRNKDGLHELCKVCRTERDKQYRQAHYSEYRTNRAIYERENRERIDAANKAYAEAHRERKSEMGKQWYLKNKERKSDMVKKWVADNKERRIKTITLWRETHKDKYMAIISKYKKNHPERSVMAEERRRSIKKQLPATLTNDQWEDTKKHFGYKCAYCGAEVALSQDHFIALTNGGGYTPNNIIPACKRCNSSKNNKSFEEWYPTREYYSAEREASILRVVSGDAV